MLISNDMKNDKNSYMLKDAVNSIETIDITAGGTELLHVIQVTAFTETIFWILLSNRILYEYDSCSKSLTAVEDSRRLCYYAISV